MRVDVCAGPMRPLIMTMNGEREAPRVVGDGDERDVVRVEEWMIGKRVLDVIDFTDRDGQPWRQLTLDDGQAVQFRRFGPWLVL